MSNEIAHGVFPSALASQPAFHPAVEPRRSPPPPVRDTSAVTRPESLAKDVQHTVAQLNDWARTSNTRLSFTLDYETHDIIVKVIDADTDKVIKELPAAELQKLHKSIKEAVGLLFDKLI